MTEARKLALAPQLRLAPVTNTNIEKRTITVLWAAGARVRRYDWFDDETFFEELDMSASAVDMRRLNNGAPVLNTHRRDELSNVIGVVERAWLEDGKGYADVRISSRPDVEPYWQDIKDKVLRNVSVGYHVHELKEENERDNGMRVMRAMKWEPFELSMVPINADRDAQTRQQVDAARKNECSVMFLEATRGSAEIDVVQPPAAAAATKGAQQMSEQQTAAAGQGAEVINDGTLVERARVKALQALGRAHQIDDKTLTEWIDGGRTPDQAAHACLQIIAERSRSSGKPPSEVGFTAKETQRYSISRAINACAMKAWDKAGFELEASRTIATKLGRQPAEYTFYVPLEVQTRDLVVATNTIGGYLVDTRNQGFIELMRNRSVLLAMGATRLSGLVGNISVPKQITAGTATWLETEDTTAGETTQTFGQMLLTPKNVFGYSEISRQLLLQSSPDVEGLVMADLSKVVALAGDLAGLAGPGTAGQPLGITASTGIGGVTIGTGGVDYGDAIEFQTDVASGNLLAASAGYVATPAVAGILMGKPRFTNSDTPIWDGSVLEGRMVGMRAMSSNQMASGRLLFGDFSQVVWAEWGVLEVEVNPYANFQAGIVGVRAAYSMDIGVRHVGAFSLATGVTS